MIQLYLDKLTNKILGYNTVVPKGISKNLILVDDEYLTEIKDLINKNLYYVDGEIIEDNDKKNILLEQINDLNEKIFEFQDKVNNEYKLFMDNIISGMSLEDASEISRGNREQLEALKREKDVLDKQREDETKKAIMQKLEKEEEKIQYKYFLSMLTIVRNENDYLEEWIRYHIEELGFEHFYIYDNESSVPVRTYLEENNFKYLDKLTIIDWQTSENSQQDSHNDFLEKYSTETKWVFPADPDEYIVLKEEGKSLRTFLEENSKYSSVQCLWKCFNANGYTDKNDEPDMVRFTQEVKWNYGVNKGKYFAQSNRINNFTNYVPNPRYDTDTLNFKSDTVKDFFQLNHYYTRSYEEWVEKINRGTCVPYAKRSYSEFFELNPDLKYLDTGEVKFQEYCPNKDSNNTDIIEDSSTIE